MFTNMFGSLPTNILDFNRIDPKTYEEYINPFMRKRISFVTKAVDEFYIKYNKFFVLYVKFNHRKYVGCKTKNEDENIIFYTNTDSKEDLTVRYIGTTEGYLVLESTSSFKYMYKVFLRPTNYLLGCMSVISGSILVTHFLVNYITK